MQNCDNGAPIPNPNSNSDKVSPNPNPNPIKAERPPLLKKSRTVTSEDQSSSLFHTPLRPAVRRNSLPSERFSGGSPPGNLNGFSSDRDWCYPSFLGPHSSRARSRVSKFPQVKQKEKKEEEEQLVVPKLDLPPLITRSVLKPPDSGIISARNHEDRVSPAVRVAEEKIKVEKKADLQNQAVLQAEPAKLSFSIRKFLGFNFSLISPLLVIACILSVSFAASLQTRVAQLEEEIVNLHRVCNGNDIGNNGNAGVLGDYDMNESKLRNIALYTVLVSLITPFLFFKYLDYLPRIKTPSTKTKSNDEEVALKKRIAYRVDVCFSLYPYAKLLALLFATILLIGFGGLALYAVSDSSLSEALWLSWTFVADSGNHADRVGMGPRVVSVSISSGGMLVFATMLGLVSDVISEKVDSWRKGKSEVIEKNHILILGWSDKLGSLLKQLAIANQSLGGGVVVVLAERDKEEMEMDITKLEFDFMGTSVICRSGSPLILADLKKVSVSNARAIIVLATDENADQSDARALRVVLSLTGVKEGLKGHVVVEMSDLDNEHLVKLVGGDLIETVVAHDVIGRLMIQCALQPGLAQIWEDILGFENAEFYIKRWPQLDGLRFEDVLISFLDAVPCGIKVAAKGGKIVLNPDDDYILKDGDEILVIAEDDDTYSPGPSPELGKGLLPNVLNPPKFPEKILFCGWRRDIDDMIMVLEAFLAPGSELWMFNEVPEKEREKKLTDGGLDLSGLVNIRLVHREGNAVIRRHLESLPLETFDSSKRLPSKAEKRTPVRHSGFSHSSWIREMQQASDKSIIISEILDSRTRNLVSVSRISDYVLSNELVSMALAMVAEDKQINRVLEELFAEEGNEMCIRPAEFYLYDQEELCYYDIMIRGRQRHEIVIGYRLGTDERAIINPPHKTEKRKWSIDDVFVVISLEE